MRLTEEDARARLLAHDHGVLGTRHPGRGVDAVPVVYAVDSDDGLGVPIDRVKPKSTTALQRVRNLDADPRATLLVDHWDAADWSRLWWVRVALQWLGAADADREARLATLLAERYPQYGDRPFDRVLVFRITGITGWSAAPSPPPSTRTIRDGRGPQ